MIQSKTRLLEKRKALVVLRERLKVELVWVNSYINEIDKNDDSANNLRRSMSRKSSALGPLGETKKTTSKA